VLRAPARRKTAPPNLRMESGVRGVCGVCGAEELSWLFCRRLLGLGAGARGGPFPALPASGPPERGATVREAPSELAFCLCRRPVADADILFDVSLDLSSQLPYSDSAQVRHVGRSGPVFYSNMTIIPGNIPTNIPYVQYSRYCGQTIRVFTLRLCEWHLARKCPCRSALYSSRSLCMRTVRGPIGDHPTALER